MHIIFFSSPEMRTSHHPPYTCLGALFQIFCIKNLGSKMNERCLVLPVLAVPSMYLLFSLPSLLCFLFPAFSPLIPSSSITTPYFLSFFPLLFLFPPSLSLFPLLLLPPLRSGMDFRVKNYCRALTTIWYNSVTWKI